ncbi:uncharacterized protein LOC135119139 [Helicoverpa armigera]|uniref:uncharacterized protein LOC135119139 n=1 Tax=Helicoverpa armigera TaxID=29058 RepID=UPI003083D86E
MVRKSYHGSGKLWAPEGTWWGLVKVLALEKVSRQKRCIVIQKQTGGKADSGEGSDDEDYDFKRPEPKAPLPDRLRNDKSDGFQRKNDVETIPPELLKYKAPSKAMYRRLRMKNRLLRNHFDMGKA